MCSEFVCLFVFVIFTDVTSNTSQDTSPTPSSDSSTDRTSDEGGSPTGGFSPNTAAIIGGKYVYFKQQEEVRYCNREKDLFYMLIGSFHLMFT